MQRLRIIGVLPWQGANKAGTIPGDVIESYDGQTILTDDDLSKAIQGAPNGGTMVVYRGTGSISLDIKETPLGIRTVPFDFNPETYDPNVSNEAGHALKRRSDIESIIVTTTPSIDGFRVVKTVDVISAECVFGMNVFTDIFASFSDFFGGRSGVSQNALREARQTCIYELKTEAHQLGANAVIGIDLDYSEFSGQGKSMLFLVASGTAVVLEKTDGLLSESGLNI